MLYVLNKIGRKFRVLDTEDMTEEWVYYKDIEAVRQRGFIVIEFNPCIVRLVNGKAYIISYNEARELLIVDDKSGILLNAVKVSSGGRGLPLVYIAYDENDKNLLKVTIDGNFEIVVEEDTSAIKKVG